MNLHIHRRKLLRNCRVSALLVVVLLSGLRLAAQNTNSTLLILSTVDAEVSVDGEAGVKVVANKAQKVPVAVGEHYLVAQAKADDDTLELTQTVTTVAGAQKMVKFDFAKAPVPPKPAPAVVGDTSGAAASILVAERNFNMPSMLVQNAWKARYPGYLYPHNPDFYFAFEKGDVVSVDFSMAHMFGTVNLVISSYPEAKVHFMKYGFEELKDGKFTVPERGIYRFSLATNAALDRTGRLVIHRTPASVETTEFNTEATFKTVYKTKVMEAPRTFYIGSDSPAVAKGPQPRATLPVICPPGTVAWYYAATAVDDTAQANVIKTQMALEQELTAALAKHTGNALPKLPAEKLGAPTGNRTCDILLMDRSNATYFGSKGAFKFLPEGSRENHTAGVVQVKCCMDDNYYFGMRPTKGQGPVAVVIAVVAIISETTWMMGE